MDVELGAYTDGGALIVSFSTDDPEGGASLGLRKWENSPGHFSYVWAANYLTRADLVALVPVLERAIEMMPEEQPANGGAVS